MADINADQEKIVKLQTHDLNYFLGKNIFINYRSKNYSLFHFIIL